MAIETSLVADFLKALDEFNAVQPRTTHTGTHNRHSYSVIAEKTRNLYAARRKLEAALQAQQEHELNIALMAEGALPPL